MRPLNSFLMANKTKWLTPYDVPRPIFYPPVTPSARRAVVRPVPPLEDFLNGKAVMTEAGTPIFNEISDFDTLHRLHNAKDAFEILEATKREMARVDSYEARMRLESMSQDAPLNNNPSNPE